MQKISFETSGIKFKEIIFPLLFFSALFDFMDLPLLTSISGIKSKINMGDIGAILCLGSYLLLYKNNIIDIVKNHKRSIITGTLFLLVCLIPGLFENPLWIVSIKYWIKIYLFFFLLIIVFMTAESSQFTLNSFCVIFIIINALGVIEYIFPYSPGLNNLFTLFRSNDLMVRKHGMASVFSNQNIYGTLNSLFFIYIILIKKNFKNLLNNYLIMISLILSLTGIFLSLSINAILTLLVGCMPVIYQSLKQKNNLKWFTLFFLSFFIIMTLSVKYNRSFRNKYEATTSSLAGIIDGDKNSQLPPSLDGRLKIWNTGIDLFKEKPIFGWGTGMTSYSLTDRIGNRHLHNCYLEILANNGITGFLVFILMLSIWLYGIRKNYFLPLIFSLLFSCLFDTFLGVSSWLVFTAWITASTFIKNPTSVDKKNNENTLLSPGINPSV